MNLQKNTESNYSKLEILEEDINWKQLFEIIIRYKKFIITFTAFGLLAGIFFALTQKRIWEGQFKIVLAPENSKKSAINSATQIFSNFINFRSSSELNTQVEILKSPSVLMPIFNEIKSKKEQKGENIDNWKYQNWFAESVNIELKKGTSVLVLKYRDTDKDIILPTLNKMSKTFQIYSSKDRLSGLKDGIKYLNNQIKSYKTKSIESSSKAISFALDNRLDVFDESRFINYEEFFEKEKKF